MPPDTPSPLLGQSGSLGVTVTCGGCNSEITPQHGNTIAHCDACEQQVGWNDGFEKFQPVRVWPGYAPEEPGDIDLAGLPGLIVGRCPTAAYDVAISFNGRPTLFALYDTEIEPV